MIEGTRLARHSRGEWKGEGADDNGDTAAHPQLLNRHGPLSAIARRVNASENKCSSGYANRRAMMRPVVVVTADERAFR